jgi:hypothetical protein
VKGAIVYGETFNTQRVQSVEDPIRGTATAFSKESFNSELGYRPNGHEYGLVSKTRVATTGVAKGERRDSDYWVVWGNGEIQGARFAAQASKETMKGESGYGVGDVTRMNFEVEKRFKGDKLRFGQQFYARDPAAGVYVPGFVSSRTEAGYRLKDRRVGGLVLENEVKGAVVLVNGFDGGTDDRAALVGMTIKVRRER